MAESRATADDVHLLERVRRSDQEAFRLLFERYQPILFRSVLSGIHDADAAHDIVQETFVRVWNHRGSLQVHLPLLALLFRISRNLVKDSAKHSLVRKKHEATISERLQSGEDNPEETLQATMLQDRFTEILRTKLPPKCREILLLSRIEGMSHAEIGEHLGISTKTVENQLTRGLKILRKHLRGHIDRGA